MSRLSRIRLLLPLLILGAAVAAPLILPHKEARRLEVLFFGAPTENGPHHDPITRYRVLKKGLGTEGINLTYSEDPSVAFTPETLGRFDAVLMYANWNQNEPMPADQLKALVDYVEAGGGFVPVHCASACYGGSPEFVELVGGRFKSHGGEEFQVRNVQPNHPILKGLKGYKAWDETYVHDRLTDDRDVLQTRDREPWTWTRTQGRGRVFYTAGGHDHRVWDLPEFHRLIRNGIYWSVGPDTYQLLANLKLPKLEQEKVSLPGYRERREITMAQKPIEPVESMKLAQVPTGMELSLFASEPDIVNPIFVSWDHRGRAFVIETIDYPNNLQAGNLGHDRITICEDTDGDGRADKFTRFAEKLSIPTSLVFANGGVICTNGSQMLFLKDTNGDDKADVREVLFEGFNMGDTHAGVSNLRYGFDGWIYATIGYSGFKGEVGGKQHQFSQGVFRFKPDASELEFLQNTTNNTWGLGFTEEFDVVGSTANGNPSFYHTFPNETYKSVGVDQGRTPAADDNPIFNPMSMDIRQVDQFDRYTAAAGHAVYTSRRFPADYRNRMAFVCGPTGKLVGNFEMTRNGGGWKAVQSPNNLYASADAWSAPVCAEVGPDGAVWVCDWYNIIVQHNPTPSRNSAGVDAKTGRGNAYETPLRDKQHGRVYRIYPKQSEDEPNPGLDPKKPATLIAGLDHPNLLWRLHAQRLIAEQGDPSLAPELIRAVQSSEFAAPHALHALAALGELKPELVQAALGSKQPAARRAAIALADPAVLKAACVTDGTIKSSGRELAEILIGLSKGASDPEIGAAIYKVAADHPTAIFDDPTLRDAWQIASRRQASAVLAAAKAAGTEGAPPEPVNVLPNSGFEESSGNFPTDWTDLRVYSGANPNDIRVSSPDNGRNGGKCLSISTDRPIDCGVAITVPVTPGTRYRLSGWVRCENLNTVGNSPGALMNIHGGQRTGAVKGTTDWTQVSVEFDSGSSREAVIHCLFGGYGGASGTAWFDDVSLVAIGSGNSLEGALDTLAAFDKAGGVSEPKELVRRFKPDAEVHARGEAVYNKTCVACHGVDGRGVPHTFPPLDGSEWLTGEADLPIKIVLHGLMGPVRVGDEVFNSAMAPLGPALNDQEIADVLTYVRQRWKNDAAPVSAEEVKKQRAATSSRTTMWTAQELGR
ncbi:carbohydrate-binding CenC domain-containing protein [Haloferula helveola]|uniref:Carbohydrate-binding CenC domain-containing protein n=1 Tax=Haloferula helveola TaxID=490095 RepID=A0ABM7RJD3_9BACT|nr:carbohydrate-binding CenC domain-containing protein [Haloferula helveola]